MELIQTIVCTDESLGYLEGTDRKVSAVNFFRIGGIK